MPRKNKNKKKKANASVAKKNAGSSEKKEGAPSTAVESAGEEFLNPLQEYLLHIESQRKQSATLIVEQQAALDQFHTLIKEQLTLLRQQNYIITQFWALLDNEMAGQKN